MTKRKSFGPSHVPARRLADDRPANAEIGETIIENGATMVHIGKNRWTFFPAPARDIEKFAKLRGWGALSTIVGGSDFVGYSLEHEPCYHTYARVTLVVGREPGLTVKGRESKGYTYRLIWDTYRTGLFELTGWYRRTSTDPRWVEFSSIAEVRPVIALHPVVRPRGEEEGGE